MIGRIMTLTAVLAMITLAHAQSGGDYAIAWSTIDGGGGQSTGGQYTVIGTIGQADSGWSRAGDYEVLGGFFPGEPPCIVGFDDFARFAEHWLVADPAGDLDNDKDVDIGDLSWLADYWLSYCPDAWPFK